MNPMTGWNPLADAKAKRKMQFHGGDMDAYYWAKYAQIAGRVAEPVHAYGAEPRQRRTTREHSIASLKAGLRVKVVSARAAAHEQVVMELQRQLTGALQAIARLQAERPRKSARASRHLVENIAAELGSRVRTLRTVRAAEWTVSDSQSEPDLSGEWLVRVRFTPDEAATAEDVVETIRAAHIEFARLTAGDEFSSVELDADCA